MHRLGIPKFYLSRAVSPTLENTIVCHILLYEPWKIQTNSLECRMKNDKCCENESPIILALFHPSLIRCSVSGSLFKVGNQSLLCLKNALAFLPYGGNWQHRNSIHPVVYTHPAETGIPSLFRTEKIENRFWVWHSKISGKLGSGPEPCARILEQSIGASNRVGTGLSYRPCQVHRLAESIFWNRFLGFLKV